MTWLVASARFPFLIKIVQFRHDDCLTWVAKLSDVVWRCRVRTQFEWLMHGQHVRYDVVSDKRKERILSLICLGYSLVRIPERTRIPSNPCSFEGVGFGLEVTSVCVASGNAILVSFSTSSELVCLTCIVHGRSPCRVPTAADQQTSMIFHDFSRFSKFFK